jgi:hypothetical protein
MESREQPPLKERFSDRRPQRMKSRLVLKLSVQSRRTKKGIGSSLCSAVKEKASDALVSLRLIFCKVNLS